MQNIFHGRKWLDKWCQALTILINHLSVIQTADFMRDVDAQAVIGQLARAREMVKLGAPHGLCVCHDSRECPLCDGEKWTSAKRLWNMLQPNSTASLKNNRRQGGLYLNVPLLRKAVSLAKET